MRSKQAGTILLAGWLGFAGTAVAQSPHETYHRFHNKQPHSAGGKVLYVQPSYPFTRYYVEPGQNPATLPHHQSDPHHGAHRFRPPNHYPPYYAPGHAPGAYEHHDRGAYGHDGYRKHDRHHGPRNRLVQDGSRLSLHDESNRVVRQIYLRPNSSWERQFGRVIVRSPSRLEVYDRNLHRIAGMYLPAGASYSFRKNAIVVKTRFYTEIYDYNLQRLERYRS